MRYLQKYFILAQDFSSAPKLNRSNSFVFVFQCSEIGMQKIRIVFQ